LFDRCECVERGATGKVVDVLGTAYAREGQGALKKARSPKKKKKNPK
jgi:hypothetical protein